ncbi:MAG: tetratricopeptide repeat protein [Candidatus Aminicenantes bacterium]|nr:tetratricopeptide repeat protein [Candidatus Aminicenantes bacterium]
MRTVNGHPLPENPESEKNARKAGSVLFLPLALVLFSFLFPAERGSFAGELQRARDMEKRGELDQAARLADVALKLAMAGGDPNEVLSAVLLIHDLLRAENKSEEALENLYQALEMARMRGLHKMQGVILGRIGEFFFDQGELGEALSHYNRGLEALRGNQWLEEEVQVLNGRAMTLALQGSWEPAMVDLSAALDYFDRNMIENPILLSVTHNYFGLILNRFNDPESARAHFEKALRIAEQCGDDDLLARYTNNLAGTYKNEGKHEEAERLFRQALEIGERAGSKKQLFVAHLYLGDLAAATGRFASCYSHYDSASGLNETLGNRQAQAILLLKRGRALLSEDRLEEARRDMESAQAIAEGIGNRDALDPIYKSLADLYGRMGEEKKALAVHEKLRRLKETIFDPKISTAIQKIQAKYEKGILAKTMEHQRSTWFKLLIGLGGLAFLALLAAVVFWLNRIRLKRRTAGWMQRKEAQIRQQKRQIEILQDKIEEYFGEKSQAKYKGSTLSEKDSQFYLKCLDDLMANAELYLDNDLTLGKLAGQMKIHPKTLSRLINEKTGNNFNEYVNRFRMAEAKRLLEDGSKAVMSILEISFDSGFNSKSTFNTLFKKEFGCSPSEYRRCHAVEVDPP